MSTPRSWNLSTAPSAFAMSLAAVLHGETVPNSDKIFSMFEPHTQLYKRGKAGEPVQFGGLVLVYEDAAGFRMQHHLMARDVGDRDVAIEQTRIVQARCGGKIKGLPFDRGFHSPDNQRELSELVDNLCLPKPGLEASRQTNRQRQRGVSPRETTPSGH